MSGKIRRLLTLALRILPALAAALIAGLAVWLAGSRDGQAHVIDHFLTIGVVAIVLVYPIAMRVVSVPVVAGIRIPGFENPASVPRRRLAVVLLTALVPLVVVTTLMIDNRREPVVWSDLVASTVTTTTPHDDGVLVVTEQFGFVDEIIPGPGLEWLCLALVLAAGLAEILIVLQAWRAVQRSRASVPEFKAALAGADVRFAIYTTRGASHRSAYQLQAWLTELQRSGQRGVVIVRDATAIKEYAAVTDWPIVLCPRTADLEIVT
ncbi:hypothetical protein SAMN06309944_1300, partial [Micrococcales bacterium KH10]